MTSRDVADAANVSQALVSRALAGKGRMAQETRERIIETARSIGWRPNALARSMVTGDAPLVAVITAGLNFDWRAQVLSQLLDALQQNGLKPLMFYAAGDEQVDALMSEALDWRTRGVIVAAGAIEPKRAQEVLDKGYFLAALNRSAHHPGAFSVATDNAAGGAQAAGEFIADERTRMLVVAGPETDWASSTRTAGFLDALSRQGLAATAWNNPEMTNQAGLASAARYLALPYDRRPDAVFVTDDAMALGFIDGLRGSVAIPEELAIIGFDNLPAASWAPYRLTTFEQPLEELVGRIVNYIREHGEDAGQNPVSGFALPDEKPILCPPRLIVRDTTRRRP